MLTHSTGQPHVYGDRAGCNRRDHRQGSDNANRQPGCLSADAQARSLFTALSDVGLFQRRQLGFGNAIRFIFGKQILLACGELFSERIHVQSRAARL